MIRSCLTVVALVVLLAPAAAQAQSRVSTFRSGAKFAAGGFPAVARSGGRALSFRGFRGAVPFAGGFGSAYGYGYDGSLLYRLGHIPVPPYFALHPPVYYSQPIPYPYGASPFARRPARAPEYAAAVKPAVMINPYYKKPAEKVQSNTASRVKTVQKTQFVLNPYYTRSAVELAKND